MEGYEFILLSNQVRFGYGYRTVEGNKEYFAFHGTPSRNDDYFVNVPFRCKHFPKEWYNCSKEVFEIC